MQPVWKGVISFGLVSIPVQLFAATEEHGVSFRQIHVSDGGQIRYRRVCTLDGEEVPYGDIGKGYELPDGQVVVLTDADFAELPLASSRAIEVLGFEDADTVDPVRLTRSYHCDPTGSDARAYVLLRDALQRTGKVALVKVALRGRESPAVLHPRDGVLVLHVLLWPDEVRTPRFKFLRDDITSRPRELQAAEAYINTLTGTLDPQDMVDRYQAALRELVEARVAGRHLEQPAAPARADSTDSLMDALRRSVEEARSSRTGGRPQTGSAKKPAGPPEAAQTVTRAVRGPQPLTAGKTEAAKRTTATKKTTAAKETTAAKKTTATKRSTAAKRHGPKKGVPDESAGDG